MCSYEEHYRMCVRSSLPSHGVKVLKRDNRGNHYDGTVYIYPPPSILGSHVKETMSFASGSANVGNNWYLENISMVEN